ncbi:hypothetical protein B0A48_18637 [Cryoendolithus antarcticus]|uniref:Protein kinase domain-containing protein n=1 Tax=Cryoendolithus antarcticus TaxID=1507870 RepID=A0A1V8S8M3_9PEZI|nr:hypothetical protein B0A48_18637 [Cryoendolithus antarcticus]
MQWMLYKKKLTDGLLFEFYDSRRAFSEQITRCLVHLHAHNFVHCDLNVSNVFVTAEMIAKVGDLQGQLYRPDGSIEMPIMSQENAKSRHPLAGDDEFSTRTDVFALGTLLYHLWHGHAPFPDLDEQTQETEIQGRYLRGEYPVNVAKAVGIDGIIGRCWTSKYTHAHEVLEDLLAIAGKALIQVAYHAAGDYDWGKLDEANERNRVRTILSPGLL